MGKKFTRTAPVWRTMDIHLHTPASGDYQQPEVTYLDIIQRAEQRGMDIIAFTDHNTVAGYRKMQDDLHQLELLERLNRILPEENQRLAEYRRLMNKMLILPGFEVTATFGFHIIGLFPPEKPVREIEHLLLSLNIPAPLIDEGSATVGATADVLTCYRTINQAGGIVIAAHANSSNGVAMRGFNFGGQTKISYTQDSNLHALEVVDLEQKGPRTSAAFFNGTKPEYPRRMHCIQGSDAHRLTIDTMRKKNLGVGDRPTDVLLPEITFTALKELFEGNDFSLTRPHRVKEEPAFDFIQVALDQGPNIIQDFHDSMTVRAGKLFAVLSDICAFANTNGGTLYIGLSNEAGKLFTGISDAEQQITILEKEISNRIVPVLACAIDKQLYKGKKIIRVLVPRGEDAPYALDDNKIYVRDEAETGLAVRDEIVNLVRRNSRLSSILTTNASATIEGPLPAAAPAISDAPSQEPVAPAPRTGVEIITPEDRGGTRYYTMRDLRNGNVVKNVTRSSARRLWAYAITRYAEIKPDIETDSSITWVGDFGLLRRHKQGNNALYDFIQRTPPGYRFYFGVTLDGVHGPWKVFIPDEDSFQAA